MTKGAARGQLGWARRGMAHPQVVPALAEGTVVTESMARIICGWTDKLPRTARPPPMTSCSPRPRAGAGKEDLAVLAAEIYARSLPDGQMTRNQRFEDRQVRVETTFPGPGSSPGT